MCTKLGCSLGCALSGLRGLRPPSAPSKEASLHVLNGASTPPHEEGNTFAPAYPVSLPRDPVMPGREGATQASPPCLFPPCKPREPWPRRPETRLNTP